jgi:hypothetical protein
VVVDEGVEEDEDRVDGEGGEDGVGEGESDIIDRDWDDAAD